MDPDVVVTVLVDMTGRTHRQINEQAETSEKRAARKARAGQRSYTSTRGDIGMIHDLNASVKTRASVRKRVHVSVELNEVSNLSRSEREVHRSE